MNFRENFTSLDLKTAINADGKATVEEKEKENKKIVVSNDALLQAEVLQKISHQLNILISRYG